MQELENLNIIDKPLFEERAKILDITSKKDEMTAKILDALLIKHNLTHENAVKLFELSKYHTYNNKQIRANVETQTTVMIRFTNAKKSKNYCIEIPTNENPFSYVIKKMKMISILQVEWNSTLMSKFDTLFTQWCIDSCLIVNCQMNFSKYCFDKLKESFEKENEFVMYINALVAELSRVVSKEHHAYPDILLNLLELNPSNKLYDSKALPSIIFSNLVFINAHDKWKRKIGLFKLKIVDFLKYKYEKGYCHFTFISEEIKNALSNFKYKHDFIKNIRSKCMSKLSMSEVTTFNKKLYPLILNCGLPYQKEWTIERVFNVIDFDRGGTLSQDELQQGLIDLFNIALTSQDILELMKNCVLDSEGNITFKEFCSKMVIDPEDWINPIYIVDRASFIQFVYDEWQCSLAKQRADLKGLVSEVTKKSNHVTCKQFYELLSHLGCDSFAGNAKKYFMNEDDELVDYLPESTIIDIIMDNQLGGYSSEFFRNYVRELFPFLHFIYKPT